MQHNENGTQKDLVLYWIETAKSDIKSAKILLSYDAARIYGRAGSVSFHSEIDSQSMLRQ